MLKKSNYFWNSLISGLVNNISNKFWIFSLLLSRWEPKEWTLSQNWEYIRPLFKISQTIFLFHSNISSTGNVIPWYSSLWIFKNKQWAMKVKNSLSTDKYCSLNYLDSYSNALNYWNLNCRNSLSKEILIICSQNIIQKWSRQIRYYWRGKKLWLRWPKSTR